MIEDIGRKATYRHFILEEGNRGSKRIGGRDLIPLIVTRTDHRQSKRLGSDVTASRAIGADVRGNRLPTIKSSFAILLSEGQSAAVFELSPLFEFDRFEPRLRSVVVQQQSLRQKGQCDQEPDCENAAHEGCLFRS